MVATTPTLGRSLYSYFLLPTATTTEDSRSWQPGHLGKCWWMGCGSTCQKLDENPEISLGNDPNDILSWWIFHVDENPSENPFFLWNLYECSAFIARGVPNGVPVRCVSQCGAAFWGLVPDGEFPMFRREQTHVVQRSFTVQHHGGGPWVPDPETDIGIIDSLDMWSMISLAI